ncbi:MAG: alpha/beta hydrolase [Patescibacteria group bacterium]
MTFSGEGVPLLCLHGWGKAVSSSAFDALRKELESANVQVIAPNLPGFGKSAEPPHVWTVDDYADCMEELIRELGLKNVHLLGHSFGGRIAIKLAARQGSLRDSAQHDKFWLFHLYLCGAAGLPQRRYLKRFIGHSLAKLGKTFLAIPGLRALATPARTLLYKVLREHDYEQASERMRETMIKVISEDLTSYLSSITVPTDLFWGEEDTMTPLADGELMNKKIVQSELHVFSGVRHRVHIERAKEIAEVILQAMHNPSPKGRG